MSIREKQNMLRQQTSLSASSRERWLGFASEGGLKSRFQPFAATRFLGTTRFLVIVVVSFAVTLSAQAARKSGDTLVYELVRQTDVTGARKNPFAGKGGGSTNYRITVTSVDGDGNAQVRVAIESAVPEAIAHARFSSALRKEWEAQNAYKQFDAKLTREGGLLVPVDNSQLEDTSTAGKSLTEQRDAAMAKAHSADFQATMAENEVAGVFALPNAVALSCARRSSLSQGDEWRVSSKTDSAIYDVKVLGKQSYQGRDVLAIDAKYHMDSPNGSVDTDATVYYDAQARLIVGMHSVTQNDIRVSGVKSTSTSDLNLKQ